MPAHLHHRPAFLPAGAIEDVQAAQQRSQERVQQQQQQQAAEQAAAAAAASSPDDGSTGGGSREGVVGDAGAGTRLGFSPLGMVAREVNCANELWMALVLTHAAVQGLAGPQLAAVLSAGKPPGAAGQGRAQAAYC